MKNILSSASQAETKAFAMEMARNAKPGDCFCLTGGLGAGKTVFAQGFAEGLGCSVSAVSPTFTVMNVYEGGRLILYHFDLYRLEDAVSALEGIGYEDYFYSDGVCLVEWADKAREIMPGDAIWININKTCDGAKREIVVHGY
jgi:tRNA threonylcarbamoyladenosine biosynthesis protein TsaE